jgi:hypothetical protein
MGNRCKSGEASNRSWHITRLSSKSSAFVWHTLSLLGSSAGTGAMRRDGNVTQGYDGKNDEGYEADIGYCPDHLRAYSKCYRNEHGIGRSPCSGCIDGTRLSNSPREQGHPFMVRIRWHNLTSDSLCMANISKLVETQECNRRGRKIFQSDRRHGAEHSSPGCKGRR